VFEEVEKGTRFRGGTPQKGLDILRTQREGRGKKGRQGRKTLLSYNQGLGSAKMTPQRLALSTALRVFCMEKEEKTKSGKGTVSHQSDDDRCDPDVAREGPGLVGACF